MNKVVKDALVKYKRLSGYHCPFRAGWDCHGLPIEHAVCKTLPPESRDPATVRAKCRESAAHWSSVQMQELKDLGVHADWENSYFTMNPHYEASTLRVFGKFVERGFVEWKLKTVPWCSDCETSLSKAELEHSDVPGSSCYAAFFLTDECWKKLNSHVELNSDLTKVCFVAWTTQPYTLPMNQAVVLAPRANYVLAKFKEREGQAAFVGEEQFLGLAEQLKLEETPVRVFTSSELNGLFVHNPLDSQLVAPVLFDTLVSLPADDANSGKEKYSTGVVHLAPSCGVEDYKVAVANGLGVAQTTTPKGFYSSECVLPDLVGKSVAEGHKFVVSKLQENQNLLFLGTMDHSYPHCWRCKNPVMFRATNQWFCSLHTPAAEGTGNLVSAAVKEVKQNVKFFPPSCKSKLVSTLLEPHEWCLSRQRSWGVPVVGLHCSQCLNAYVTPSMVEQVANEVQTHGLEAWPDMPMETLNPCCPHCGNKDPTQFKKETNVLDVWFDSGTSYYSVFGDESAAPYDVYFEGTDQHRGWFQSSLLCSMVSQNKSPMKNILTHGFLVDQDGKKFSKSLGNGVTPQQVRDEYNNNDVMRLWACSADWRKDVKCTLNSAKKPVVAGASKSVVEPEKASLGALPVQPLPLTVAVDEKPAVAEKPVTAQTDEKPETAEKPVVVAEGKPGAAAGGKQPQGKKNQRPQKQAAAGAGGQAKQAQPESLDSFAQTTVSYRKLRNCFRFLLCNLVDFKSNVDSVKFEELSLLDQCVLATLNDCTTTVNHELDQFSLHTATTELVSFCNNLSSFYFERVKPTLYFEHPNSKSRRAVQTTCSVLLLTLAAYLSPVCSFLAEEVYQTYLSNTTKPVLVPAAEEAQPEAGSNGPEQPPSVHMRLFSATPSYSWSDVAKLMPSKPSDQDMKTAWNDFMKLKNFVNVEVETARKSGLFVDSFQAGMNLTVGTSAGKNKKQGKLLFELVNEMGNSCQLSDLFLVSEMKLTEDENAAGGFAVAKFWVVGAAQCQRCRRYRADQGVDLCTFCSKVLQPN